MSKIPWMEELIEGVLKDGTPVKAMCWYWAKDINVELISPYLGLRHGPSHDVHDSGPVHG